MKKLYYGAALYPELWSENIVEKDISHMQSLGMNLVRFGEFAWSTFEPEQDCFNMTMVTKTLELLKKYNMDAIICTPTATPPIWMTHNHEERLHHTADKKPLSHGSRQHICTNNAFFRDRSIKITEKIALTANKYSNVIAFQLDNEFKCHVGPCHCDNCRELWHDWLKRKYRSIEELNEKWGTNVWSQTYLNFNQVVQPISTPFIHNSSLINAYQEFSLEKIAEFANEQASVIRSVTDIPITHNSSLGFDLDNELLARSLDFISFDTYAPYDNYTEFMMNNDRWPNIKENSSKYMLLETSTSYNGHTHEYGQLHPKGYVTAEAFATYASGAQAFNYWLFRGQKTGCEQPHGSVVSSWGEPTIGYSNVVDTSKMLKNIKPFLLSTEPIEAKVAIVYSDRARSFIDSEPGEGYNYKEMMTEYYNNFLELGIERKLVPENFNLEKCSVLFTPFVHYISSEFLSRIKTFVEEGGVWIVGPMTGDRTKEHTWHIADGLGELGELAGVKDIIQFPATNSGNFGEIYGITAELEMMSNVFKPHDGTKVKGHVKRGQAEGYAFVTEKPLGKGKIVLVGSMPVGYEGKLIWQKIIRDYTSHLKLKNKLILDSGIVVIPRKNLRNNKQQYWLVNFTNEEKGWKSTASFYDLLEDKEIKPGKYLLPPFGYKTLEA